MTVSYLKSGPNICPVCKKRCRTVPDQLSPNYLIHIHKAKYLENNVMELTKRCISNKDDSLSN